MIAIIKRTRKAAYSTFVKPPKQLTLAHQRHKDEKLMFGGVLETKRDKKKRERIEKKEKVRSTIGADSIDSEVHWVTNSKFKETLKTSDVDAQMNHCYSLSPEMLIRTGDIDSNDSEAFWVTKSTKFVRKMRRKTDDISQNNPINNSEAFILEPKKISIPELLVQNMTTVPLFPSEVASVSASSEQYMYPSVTRILNDTMTAAAKAALDRWKETMIAKLGEEGFIAFNEAQLSFGARFHAHVKNYLEGGNLDLDSDLEAVWHSVQPVLGKISDVNLLETYVYHSKLKYKGVVDCVASYENTPCVIEWKVSEKLKPTLAATYDAPQQLTAYLGALSHNRTVSNVNNGLVVVSYKDGTPAQVFPMKQDLCQKHWQLWLRRLQSYWQFQCNLPASTF